MWIHTRNSTCHWPHYSGLTSLKKIGACVWIKEWNTDCECVAWQPIGSALFGQENQTFLPLSWQCVLTSICALFAYREHRGGEQTPCEKLQEDDDHSMVNTGLTDSLRLKGCSDTDRHVSCPETQAHFLDVWRQLHATRIDHSLTLGCQRSSYVIPDTFNFLDVENSIILQLK